MPKVEKQNTLLFPFTSSSHSEVLLALRAELEVFQKNLREENFKLRLRNCLYYKEGASQVFDIVLDREASCYDANKNPISFDECLEFHKYLIDRQALDFLSDSVEVRIGTKGSEPTLYDLEDYRSALGDMVKVQTWEVIYERRRFSMTLEAVLEETSREDSSIRLKEGEKAYQIPLHMIKEAKQLLYHPNSNNILEKKNAL